MADKKGIKKSAGDDVLINKRGMKSINKVPYLNLAIALALGKVTKNSFTEKLESFGFEPPAKLFEDVRNYIELKMPGYLDNNFRTYKDIDMDVLEDMKLSRLFGYIFKVQVKTTDGIKGAFRILDDPLMYRLITSLCIAGITEEDIELLVNGKFNAQYAADDIDQFVYYFFSMNSWSRVQKQEWVKNYAPREYKQAYRIALKGDKDYLIWKLGAAPDKSYEGMLKEMLTDSFYNFKERARNDPDLAQKWGTLAVKLSDKLDRLHKDTEKSSNIFDMLEFDLGGSEDNSTVHVEDLEEINEMTKENQDENLFDD